MKGCVDMKFYYCAHCGNIITFMENKGVPVMCCGEKMQELKAGVTDAAAEKHVPVVNVNNGEAVVEVGSVAHPMTEEHYIEWIVLETSCGTYIRRLSPSDAPKAFFKLHENEKVTETYAYCNLHGLWKA